MREDLRIFPNSLTVVGGEARVAAYSLIHKLEWPHGYVPRDLDYVREASEEERTENKVGILYNETLSKEGKHVDSMVVSSLEDYFAGIDQHTNGVAVVNNKFLKITDEALRCFTEKQTRLNLDHPRLAKGGVSFWEYLALRACVQTGWDVRRNKQYHRHHSCNLHASIYQQLDYFSLKENWWWDTYCLKMRQVKSGNH